MEEGAAAMEATKSQSPRSDQDSMISDDCAVEKEMPPAPVKPFYSRNGERCGSVTALQQETLEKVTKEAEVLAETALKFYNKINRRRKFEENVMDEDVNAVYELVKPMLYKTLLGFPVCHHVNFLAKLNAPDVPTELFFAELEGFTNNEATATFCCILPQHDNDPDAPMKVVDGCFICSPRTLSRVYHPFFPGFEHGNCDLDYLGRNGFPIECYVETDEE